MTRSAGAVLKHLAFAAVLFGCATTTPVKDTHTLATTQRSDQSHVESRSNGGASVDRDVNVDLQTGTVVYHSHAAVTQPSQTITISNASDRQTIDDVGHLGASISGWMPDSVTMEGFAAKQLGSEWRTKVPVALAVMILGAIVFYLGDRLEGFVLFGVGIAVACLPNWMVALGIAIAVLCLAWPLIKKSSLVTALTAGIERGKIKIAKHFPDVAQAVNETLTTQLEAEQTRPQSDKIDKVRQSAAVKAAVAVVAPKGALT